MAKGEYLREFIAPDGSADETGQAARERRHWLAFWGTFPPWLKQSIMSATGALGMWAYFQTNQPKSEETYWNEKDIAGIIEKSVDRAIDKRYGKFEAEWKAFINTQPEKTQLLVFKAGARLEEKQRGN